jgi:hypothetical protein
MFMWMLHDIKKKTVIIKMFMLTCKCNMIRIWKDNERSKYLCECYMIGMER